MKLLLALVVAALGVAADLPSGESLLQRSLERTGGANYAKARSVVMTGTVEMAGHNISGPISIYQSGDRSYTVIEFPGIGTVEEGFDGETAWEMSALQGARIKTGEEQAAAQRASRMTMLSSWRDFYKKAVTLGSEDVDGKPAWKVELTPTAGQPETYYLDRQSGLLVRITQTIPTALGDIPVDISMSDYRLVDGIQTPFSMTQKAMSQVMAMHFDKISYNQEIPASRFDPPAAITALREKKK